MGEFEQQLMAHSKLVTDRAIVTISGLIPTSVIIGSLYLIQQQPNALTYLMINRQWQLYFRVAMLLPSFTEIELCAKRLATTTITLKSSTGLLCQKISIYVIN